MTARQNGERGAELYISDELNQLSAEVERGHREINYVPNKALNQSRSTPLSAHQSFGLNRTPKKLWDRIESQMDDWSTSREKDTLNIEEILAILVPKVKSDSFGSDEDKAKLTHQKRWRSLNQEQKVLIHQLFKGLEQDNDAKLETFLEERDKSIDNDSYTMKLTNGLSRLLGGRNASEVLKDPNTSDFKKILLSVPGFLRGIDFKTEFSTVYKRRGLMSAVFDVSTMVGELVSPATALGKVGKLAKGAKVRVQPVLSKNKQIAQTIQLKRKLQQHASVVKAQTMYDKMTEFHGKIKQVDAALGKKMLDKVSLSKAQRTSRLSKPIAFASTFNRGVVKDVAEKIRKRKDQPSDHSVHTAEAFDKPQNITPHNEHGTTQTFGQATHSQEKPLTTETNPRLSRILGAQYASRISQQIEKLQPDQQEKWTQVLENMVQTNANPQQSAEVVSNFIRKMPAGVTLVQVGNGDFTLNAGGQTLIVDWKINKIHPPEVGPNHPQFKYVAVDFAPQFIVPAQVIAAIFEGRGVGKSVTSVTEEFKKLRGEFNFNQAFTNLYNQKQKLIHPTEVQMWQNIEHSTGISNFLAENQAVNADGSLHVSALTDKRDQILAAAENYKVVQNKH